MFGQVTNINEDNIETKTNGNLNRASALMSQYVPLPTLCGVRSTGLNTPRSASTIRRGTRIIKAEVEAAVAAMEIQEVEDHGKGRRFGEEAEAIDEDQASLSTAQANLTPIIIDEPSTTPLYNLIDMPARVLVASDNKELLGKESTIIPSEHKNKLNNTKNNDIKNNQ